VFTLTETPPFQRLIGEVDHKGADECESVYDPHCPLYREEREKQ